ncbi:GlsB/YeaQ/YmgE family stress response membrane protein [Sphaerisporangium rhizosphaerae]|uniref:GlsB/YeaQ/YmgE family stress response membrane protein n=1 Tax=Sphaerisporangium rhizosphaerae TaxID=2269375 RepID=A0ABW2NZV2_9ACTN
MLILLIAAVVTGTIVGGLGRLVLPGRQNIGWPATILAGTVAAQVGGGIAYLFHFDDKLLLVLLVEVVLAAICVSVVAKAQAGKGGA